ncbi:ATP-dependent RNA helicase HrpA [Kiritimatiellota bacterium B12222]|nr:ATP-dependent RNA helicase HrpA [Kiritimatiellota bacterium B12222]
MAPVNTHPPRIKTLYPEALPVSQRREELLQAIRDHQVVIVCGDTGSGKTTQLPKMVYEVVGEKNGRIGVTQPRRLAATSMAARVAEECQVNLGQEVGVQVRFQNRTSPHTRIQFMTDGLLLAQLPKDPDLRGYSALIIDEAHERSLNIDFILGCLKNLLPRRPDLKVVISSATLDAERFSEFYTHAPIIEVEGRLFPIQDEWFPPDENRDLSIQDQVLEALQHLDQNHGPLDTLVFLPGEREIRECTKKLTGRYQHSADILPLFARLGTSDQQKVFSGGSRRRIILATNVAETSLTLPGIRAVVDTGQVRVQRFHPQSRIQRLVTEQISRASARQRRGRCGRTGPGVCIRMYTEEALERAGDYQDPEIRRSSLAEVILRMAVLGLPPIQEFPFIDPPRGAAVSEGYRTLFDIGAMTKKRALTRRGRQLATFHLDPRLARMLEEGHTEKVLPAVLVCAAFLSIQDPRERPADKAEAADNAHASWKDPESDFLGVLAMWNDICAASTSRSKRTRFCRQHFLHPRRVEEWLNLVDDLRETCQNHKWDVPRSIGELELLDTDGLHRSILAGVPRSIGEKEENQHYRSAGGQTFRIFPGSALSKKPPSWVMTFTLLETSQLFAREAAHIDPEWVEEVAAHLCKYQYERPTWNPKRGFVEAEERVSLGQLTLRSGKRVHYGRIDPAAARDIFIRDALVPGKLQLRHPSWKKYLKQLRSLDSWEQKLRRPGYFLGSDVFEQHFKNILPDSICTLKDFEKWIPDQRWVPELKDLLGGEALQESDYPDHIELKGIRIKLSYRYQPDDPETDGLTFVIREQDLSAVPNELAEWTLPAWLPEKVESLIRSLDKPLRIQCNPIKVCASEAITWFHQNHFVYTHSLRQALAAFLAARLDCILAAPDLNPDQLPGYLKSKIAITDRDGKVIYRGLRFPGQQELPKNKKSHPQGQQFPWMISACTQWPTLPIPESVEIKGQRHWPALADQGKDCAVKLYPNALEAQAAWKGGILRLYKLQETDRFRYLQKQLPLPTHLQLELSLLPSRGENALEDLIDSILSTALRLDQSIPTTAEEFSARCESARGELFEIAQDTTLALGTLLNERSKVQDQLAQLQDSHVQPDLELQAATLWYPGWCADPENLTRYPKYLKGMEMRIQRAKQDASKDHQKWTTLQPALDQLSTNAARLSPRQLRAAFLKIQELRLAIFAPECRPHEKMSVQRFSKWMNEQS